MPAISCPKCSYSRSWPVRRDKRKCKRCRAEFSPRAGAVAGTRVRGGGRLRAAALAFVAFRTVRRVSCASGVSEDTAQKVCHAFRQAIAAEPREAFAGPVEVDETYVGGSARTSASTSGG
jgi:hypothetical protein